MCVLLLPVLRKGVDQSDLVLSYSFTKLLQVQIEVALFNEMFAW